MHDVAAIVLAAGLSRRMGAVNKLLVEIDGSPVIRTVASACLSVCDAPVTVVTGYQAEDIEGALAGLSLRFVYNPDYASGQAGSVATGLRAAPDARATLVVLGDQPLIDTGALRKLIKAHRASDQSRITVPVRDEDRGNPLIVPSGLKTALLADRKNPGCGRFTRNNPQYVNPVAMSDPAYFTDIDTLEDLRAFQANPALRGGE